ncbi:MAG: C69 family dipeptidase [Mucinivorans sp.]
MKKILSALFILSLGLASLHHAMACSNILVTKGASKSGSTMVSYTADSHTLYGALYLRPAASYPEGTMMQVREWDTGKILGQIPQATHTYSVVGNMNEHQLLIGESTWGGLPQLVDPNGIIDYGSFIYLALQRCKTARQAVEFIGQIVSKYGYASSGESISIADPNEVWFLEIIGKGSKIKDGKNLNKGAVWVALRLPDGAISAHANQARITQFPLNDPENCIYAPDVISFAKAEGLYKGADKDFSFSDTYCPLDFSGMRACEARVWSVFRQVDPSMEKYMDYAMGHNAKNRMPLWVMANHKVDVKEVAQMMRNHYEDTPMDMHNDMGAGPHKMPYRWRPMEFEVDGCTYLNERAIATQQTGWWFVGECRSWLPDPVGGVFWFGTDDTATSPLTPFYCGITRVPEAYKEGNGHMTEWAESSFWIQNRVANFTYLRYDELFKDVKRAMDRFENRCFDEQPAIDMAAKMLYEKNPELAIAFLTDYSCNTATALYKTWVDLDKYLLVKFIDGNTKKESAEGIFVDNGNNYNIPTGPEQKGYSEQWKRMVAEDTGDRLKVVK